MEGVEKLEGLDILEGPDMLDILEGLDGDGTGWRWRGVSKRDKTRLPAGP